MCTTKVGSLWEKFDFNDFIKNFREKKKKKELEE